MLGACRNADPIVSHRPDDGPVDRPISPYAVLVEHDYENYAWGYQHHGITVEDDGSVYKYAWTRGEAPWQEPEGATISVGQLTEKHAHAREMVGRVGADTLAMIRSLLPAAARGPLTDRQSNGADMGQYTRLGYILDTQAGTYTKVTLRVHGDFAWYNTTPEAAQLADIVDAIAERHR
jgi:hypothetical protein